MKSSVLTALATAGLLLAGSVISVFAGNERSLTAYNAHVDGPVVETCENPNSNCNQFSARERVWLNGTALAERPVEDGDYFFAVLAPGGQSEPNDDSEKNLSDDFDAYTERTFTLLNGALTSYGGSHWLDSGMSAPIGDYQEPDNLPPFIRLYPFAATANPGGVYILAVCSLADGYPVDSRDCNYDAFTVKEDPSKNSAYLAGTVYEDFYADGARDGLDSGLHPWKIHLSATGLDGVLYDHQTQTDKNGYWDFQPPAALFSTESTAAPVDLIICAEPNDGWTQSAPQGGCHTLSLTTNSFDPIFDLDFGFWQPVEITACYKRSYLVAPEAVADRSISLSMDGVLVDTQLTGPNGCYTWSDLVPGAAYGVKEETASEGYPTGPEHWIFPRAKSGEHLSYIFHSGIEGCTPGFWQGGNAVGTAGGRWLWDEEYDQDWLASGGSGWNPFIWTTPFNDYFSPYSALDGIDMITLVDQGGGSEAFQKAARDLVAAYLNAAWGMNYSYSPDELISMWDDALVTGDFLQLHELLDEANNAYKNGNQGNCPIDRKNGELIYRIYLPLIIK